MKAIPLAEDAGEYFRDKNAAWYPEHPMDAGAQAILVTEPTSVASLDVFACQHTLRNLLRFVCGQDKSFRILVEAVGDTVFLARRENSPTELIPDVRGYGHTFPEAYTSWDADVKGSLTHQRLAHYTFGILKLAVRFEGDRYIADDPLRTEVTKNTGVDDLIADLCASGDGTAGVSAVSKFEIRHGGGTVVAQDAVFDLKTRSIKKKGQDVVDEELPRLWIAQVSKFVLAYHTCGVFDDIEIIDVRKDIESWERTHSAELAKLAALLHKIIAEVRQRADGKTELQRHESGRLEFREQLPDVSDALSKGTEAQWVSSPTARKTDDAWAQDEDYTLCSEACEYCGQCAH